MLAEIDVLVTKYGVKEDRVTYSRRSESVFTRTFALYNGDRVIGSMRATNVFTRDLTIDLPDELSLARPFPDQLTGIEYITPSSKGITWNS